MSALPTGWTATTFNSLGALFCGQSPSSSAVNVAGNGTPYVTGPEQWDGQRLHLSKWTTDPKRVVPDGCIFITVKGAGVGTLFPGIACAIGRDVYAFLPRLGLDPKFISLALTRNILSVKRAARGDIPGLSKADILDHAVELPPLQEERRIVAKMDSLSAKYRRARDQLDHIPRLVEKYKQAILAVTFREGRSSAKKIWPTKPFFEVLDFKGGSQPPKSTFSVSARAGFVRLLQIRDFASDKKAVFIRDSDRWPKCATDDIMVGRYGASVGKVLTGKAGAYNVALVKIIIDPTIFDKRFVFYWLQADAFQNALKVVSRSAQNGFNKSDLESLYVPVPSLSEQKQAVRFIENAFSWVDRICSETNSARKLIEHLDQSILAKAFRGELVPQDPKDEPARVLLERIKAEREDNRSARRGRRTSAGSPA